MLTYETAIIQTILSFEKLDNEVDLRKIESYYNIKVTKEDYDEPQPWIIWLEGATDTISTIYDKPYFTVLSSMVSQAKLIQSNREEIEKEEKRVHDEIEKIFANHSPDELNHLYSELKKFFEE